MLVALCVSATAAARVLVTPPVSSVAAAPRPAPEERPCIADLSDGGDAEKPPELSPCSCFPVGYRQPAHGCFMPRTTANLTVRLSLREQWPPLRWNGVAHESVAWSSLPIRVKVATTGTMRALRRRASCRTGCQHVVATGT